MSENFGVEEHENTLLRERCSECDVGVGQLHHLGCDVESCPYCGEQLITCGHLRSENRRPPDDDRLPWTGFKTGTAECVRWGWYVRPTPDGSIRCGKDEPHAELDLNRLDEEARWDRRSKQWERLTDDQMEACNQVARDITPLLSGLKRAGIHVGGEDTISKPGMISLLFYGQQEAKEFLELVVRYEPGRGSLYRRAIKGEGVGKGKCWLKEVIAFDVCDHEDANKRLEIDQWWFVISFPLSDYKVVLQRVKEFNEAAARDSEGSKRRDAGSGSERVLEMQVPTEEHESA